MARFLRFFLLLFILFAFAAPSGAAAQAADSVTMTVRAGFDRTCKEGHWFPVRVTLENKGPDLEGQVEARLRSMQGSEIVYTAPVILPTTSRKEITLYIYPGSYLSELPVSFRAARKTLAQEKVRLDCVGAADILFGVLSGNVSAYSILADLDPPNGKATVAELETGDITERSQALEALDVLVISDIDTGSLSAGQRAALADWAARGGRLWIAGGPGWQKTAAGLGDLLPLIPEGAQTLENLSDLQALSATGDRLEGNTVAATGRLAAGAETMASQNGLPLIVRKTIGSGEAIFLAVDPGLAPMKNWDGRIDLYRSLLSSERVRPTWGNGFQDWYSAAQAATILSKMNLPSGFLICGLLGLYIAAIGPLNFFVLRKFKRRELAWLSIPVLVIVFSGAAFLFGSRLRGSRPLLNRLAIVQMDAGSQTARVDGLLGVYSPSRKSYRLKIGESFLAHPIPNSEGYQQWTLGQVDGGMELSDLHIDIGEIVPLALEGSLPALAITHNLGLSLQKNPVEGVQLQGKITNASPLTLHGAVLLAPGVAQALGDFKPGVSLPIDLALTRAQGADQPGKPGIALPSGPAFVPPPALYSADTTIADILGTSTYYDNKDSYRRYLMLAAALNANLTGGSRGGGIYLSGWVQTSPLDVSLGSGGGSSPVAFDTVDTTLYLVTIHPTLKLDQEQIVLPPGLFAWRVLESSQYIQVSPYGTYLSGGSYTLQFDLAQPVAYTQVESLVLHLESSSASGGSTGVSLALWSWAEENWVIFSNLGWGDSQIPGPGRFVGPGGSVRLRITDDDPARDTQIDRSDFTLIVKR